MAAERRFSDVQRMLEQAGYYLARVRGSHHVFAKAGEQPISIPVHSGMVKPFYVRQVEKICQGD
ncbi:MAG TPA: type II toxin-antitoxin system HicA family toxin [Pirellulales bacterium]